MYFSYTKANTLSWPISTSLSLIADSKRVKEVAFYLIDSIKATMRYTAKL